MLHASIVRSPHAHARILGIDATQAQQLPGVVEVILPDDIRAATRPIPEGWDTKEAGAKRVDWYALAQGRVRYIGEAVAMVVADTAAGAEAAAAIVAVEYEMLEAVESAEKALDPDSPLVEPSWGDNILISDSFVAGDPDSAFAGPLRRTSGTISSQRITGVPIEPRGILAQYNHVESLLTFWDSTQQPHQVRTLLAEALGVTEASIHVIQPDVGGAFGLKQPLSQEEVLVAFAARRLSRPVRWLESRVESLMVGGHARETSGRYEVAFTDEGVIEALRLDLLADVGAPTAYLGWGMSFVTMYSIPTVYRIPNVAVSLQSVVTNKCPWTPYRGFGKDVASFIMDRIIEDVSRRLGVSSVEVRRRNFIQPDQFPFPQASGAMLDSGNYAQTLDALMELVDYDGFREVQRRARAEGRHIGLGIGQELTPEGVSMPGSIMNQGYDGATVRVMPTGAVMVLAGVTSPGTGNETGLAQIAAEALGCEVSNVSVVQGDTDACPWGLGNYSSRSIIIGGSAVIEACQELRDRLHTVAAAMLGCGSDALGWGGGKIWVVEAPERWLPFADVVERIYWHAFEEHSDLVEPGLEATRYFRIPNIYHQPERDGRFSVYPTWPNGIAAAVVEVDRETGHVRLLRHVLVEDAGTLINPLLANANLHGGIAQGIGSAMYEELAYDESGQLLTATFMDYTIPTAVELPRLEVSHKSTPSPFTPLGAKGVGESGMGSSLGALCNAIEDAFPDLDIFFDRLPLTPQRVWNAIREAKPRTSQEVAP
jgi:aerobic carbon-monoxide dehydrogenase large subunit